MLDVIEYVLIKEYIGILFRFKKEDLKSDMFYSIC